MPDFANFAITYGSSANVNVPNCEIACQIIEGADTLADFTGDNVIRFPSVLSTLTSDEYAYILGLISNTLIYMKAGMFNQ